MEIRKELISKGYSVLSLSTEFGVNRSTIYQSIDGDGSRCIRVEIARILNTKPSDLWPDNPVLKKMLDDALFCHGTNLSHAPKTHNLIR